MAAAFERARVALDQAPQLSATMESVLRRCGSRVDLLLDTAGSCCNIKFDGLPSLFIDTAKMAEGMSNHMLPSRPLLTALQQGAARCERCSPLGRLAILSVAVSGSSVERLAPETSRGDEFTPITTSSDMDLMLQLGPVLWEKTDAVCSGSEEAALGSEATLGSTGTGLGQQGDETAPRLRVVPTENPGFVLLYQVKQEQCQHQDEHQPVEDPPDAPQIHQAHCRETVGKLSWLPV